MATRESMAHTHRVEALLEAWAIAEHRGRACAELAGRYRLLGGIFTWLGEGYHEVMELLESVQEFGQRAFEAGKASALADPRCGLKLKVA